MIVANKILVGIMPNMGGLKMYREALPSFSANCVANVTNDGMAEKSKASGRNPEFRECKSLCRLIKHSRSSADSERWSSKQVESTTRMLHSRSPSSGR